MTNPSYRLITPQANSSFVFKWEPFGLTTRWHYHPEIELIYFIEGRTTGVIGDGFQQFAPGDLVILGANFPHVLQEDPEYARQHPDDKPFGLIIQFNEEFLGAGFWNRPEMQPVIKLLKKANRGLSFNKSAVARVSDILLNMHQLSEPRKLITLLEVLVTLTEGETYEFMTSKDYAYDHTQDEDRMRSINEYVYENFRRPISIPEIAEIASMTETSFCRYFKTRTLKTFTRFLNEIRIAYSCRLLNNVNISITNVCFDSGFNDLSYFTTQFKAITKMSPNEYRKWKNLLNRAA
jgi:AraC-like DNA-binding protein